MGGALTNVLHEGIEKLGQLTEKYVEPYATQSAERTLQKMGPQGEVLLGQVKKFEQAWKSGTEDMVRTTGMPRDDASRMAKSLNADLHFGRDKSFLTNQLKGIETQYKSPETGAIKKRTAADIMSVYLKEPGTQPWRQKAGVDPHSPYTKQSELETGWGKFASWIYLSKIAIPHTMQPLNLLLEGRSTAAFGKALFESASNFKSALDQTEKAGALTDEYLHASRPTTAIGKAMENVFHMPAFKYMRKFQIVTSAIDGKYSAIESAEKYKNSGFTSNAEEVFLRHLGIDPRDIKSRGLQQNDIDKAMYSVAHNTMYIRTGLEVPHQWSTNATTRLATQYKGYSFNQARIMADAYRRSYKMNGLAGIAKTSAITGALFPIAGEFIWSIDSLVNTGDPTNRDDVMKNLDDGGPIDNYISALSHMAGLGIGYSVMRAANRNALESYLLGPMGNFIADEFTGIAHGVSNGDFDRFFRTNFRKVPVVGSYIQRKLLPTQAQQKADTL